MSYPTSGFPIPAPLRTILRLIVAAGIAAAIPAIPARAIPQSFDDVIRVGLHSECGVRAVSIELTAPAAIVDLATSRAIGRIEPGRIAVALQDGQVTASEFRSTVGFRIASLSDSPARIGRCLYPGAIEIWKDGGGLATVDEVGLEAYVVGSLLVEGSPSFPPEATKALAVAIRTYAVRSRGKHDGGLYDVCDTTHCQGYIGTRETDTAWARRAGRETSGQILTWKGEPIWSLYSTDCGGSTASNEDGGAGDTPWPYLRAVSALDPSGRDFCAASPFHHWSYSISLSRLDSLLSRALKAWPGPLLSIAVDRTDRFGRAVTVRLEYRSSGGPIHAQSASSGIRSSDAGRSAIPGEPDRLHDSRTIKATALRSLLGDDLLKSTHFRIRSAGAMVQFEGQGYGHGMGMCLFGAMGMAKAGIRYREILARYFTGAELVQWFEPLPGVDSLRIAGTADRERETEP